MARKIIATLIPIWQENYCNIDSNYPSHPLQDGLCSALLSLGKVIVSEAQKHQLIIRGKNTETIGNHDHHSHPSVKLTKIHIYRDDKTEYLYTII